MQTHQSLDFRFKAAAKYPIPEILSQKFPLVCNSRSKSSVLERNAKYSHQRVFPLSKTGLTTDLPWNNACRKLDLTSCVSFQLCLHWWVAKRGWHHPLSIFNHHLHSECSTPTPLAKLHQYWSEKAVCIRAVCRDVWWECLTSPSNWHSDTCPTWPHLARKSWLNLKTKAIRYISQQISSSYKPKTFWRKLQFPPFFWSESLSPTLRQRGLQQPSK